MLTDALKLCFYTEFSNNIALLLNSRQQMLSTINMQLLLMAIVNSQIVTVAHIIRSWNRQLYFGMDHLKDLNRLENYVILSRCHRYARTVDEIH